MIVSSKDNRFVKEWRALSHEAKARRQSGRFALEGARLCGDALASGVGIETVLYTADAAVTYAPVVRALTDAAEQVVEITDALAKYMADTTHPQGVFCVVKSLDNLIRFDTIDIMGCYGVLEDIQDPGNLGTIIRTAEALGLNGLILSSGCCDVYNPKVLRGSMGGVFRLPILVTDDLPSTIDELQRRGMTAYACVVDADATAVHTVTFAGGRLCVIGNEGNGLSAAVTAACAKRITIRMAGRAESLNASMAAGIVLWEMTRPTN